MVGLGGRQDLKGQHAKRRGGVLHNGQHLHAQLYIACHHHSGKIKHQLFYMWVRVC
jgi:hypothetical protein